MNESKTLDLTGLKCPGPIVALNTEIRQITGGDELEALSDDPAFELDVKAWCRRTGHELMSVHALNGVFRSRIRRKA
jgi:tRNA 2-thiouridine synthesizing protein A